MKEGEAIIHPWVNKALEKAQGKVEARNFDIRKNLLKYDDVMNDQRKAVFAQRREIMEAADVAEVARDMRHQVVDDLVAEHVPGQGLRRPVGHRRPRRARSRRPSASSLPLQAWADEEGVDDEDIRERLTRRRPTSSWPARPPATAPRPCARSRSRCCCRPSTQNWREHLVTLDHLRSVVGFRGYAQRDPLNEYKSEAFQLFETLLNRLRSEVTRMLAHVQMMTQEEQQAMLAALQARAAEPSRRSPPRPPARAPAHPAPQREPAMAGAAVGAAALNPAVDPADPATWGASGRNDPCPCGSGKKYKHCHGRV